MSSPPDFTAPLPTHFDTGFPVPTERGIWRVYSWLHEQGRWYCVLASTMEETARSFVRELEDELSIKGVPCCYRIIENGKEEADQA